MTKRKERKITQEEYPNSGVMTNEQLNRLLETEGWVEYPLEVSQKIKNYLVEAISNRTNVPKSLIVVVLEGDMVEVIRGAEFDKYFQKFQGIVRLIRQPNSKFYRK